MFLFRRKVTHFLRYKVLKACYEFVTNNGKGMQVTLPPFLKVGSINYNSLWNYLCGLSLSLRHLSL